MKNIGYRILLLSLPLTAIVAAAITGGCGGAAFQSASNMNGPSESPSPVSYETNVANRSMNAAANRPANYKASNSVANAANQPSKNASEKAKPTPKPIEKKDDGLFSFPPPRVTSALLIDPQTLTLGAGASFGDVAKKLAEALTDAGYSGEKFSYFWNDSNEFAIVTRMERIDANGAPLIGNERWNDSEQFPVSSADEYTSYLFNGKKVFYRVFSFVVTRKNYNFYKNSPPSFDVAKDWMGKGFPILRGDETAEANPNPNVQDVEFTAQYHCYALLYIFVNHTSLDNAKSVNSLVGMEKTLIDGLSEEVQTHLCNTKIKLGGCQ